MRSEQAQERPVAELRGVTFARARRGGLERLVPQRREQPVRIARAEAVRAFAAHPRRRAGFGHAAGGGESVEERELAPGRPAVASNSTRALLHRPAWITGGGL